jgi:dephospho-CoA kinase
MPKLNKAPYGNRIAFVGTMAVGKTTAAKYLVEHHGYEKRALADKLKAIAYEMFGVTGKDGGDRLILQKLGTEWFRSIDPDVWTKYLLSQIQREDDRRKEYKVVVDDARFPNEAKLLRKNGFIVIRLMADETVRADRIARLYPNTPPEAFQHASETQQHTIKANLPMSNNVWADLTQLDNLIDNIKAWK